MGFKLPHDVVSLSRSVTNRRADGGLSTAFALLMTYGLWLIVWLVTPSAKRIQTAEPQAAVGILSLLFRNLQTMSFGDCRLLRGGNLCNLCDLWFRKNKNSCSFVVLTND